MADPTSEEPDVLDDLEEMWPTLARTDGGPWDRHQVSAVMLLAAREIRTLRERITAPPDPELVEVCLRILHGEASWGLIKNQWPEVAVEERRRKMAEIIVAARSAAGTLQWHSP